MQADDNATPPQILVVGQQKWEPDTVASASSLEGELRGVSAFWVMYAPEHEQAGFLKTLHAFPDHHLFTWAAGIKPEPPPEPATNDHEHICLHRVGRRAGTKKFPQLPFMESTYRRYSHFDAADYPNLDRELHRGSGYALGIGPKDLPSDAWTVSAQTLETHFSWSFDIENTPAQEILRGKLLSTYVEAAVDKGIWPLVPLNRDPCAGIVFFCARVAYSAIANKLATIATSPLLEYEQANQEISRLRKANGGMNYR